MEKLTEKDLETLKIKLIADVIRLKAERCDMYEQINALQQKVAENIQSVNDIATRAKTLDDEIKMLQAQQKIAEELKKKEAEKVPEKVKVPEKPPEKAK